MLYVPKFKRYLSHFSYFTKCLCKQYPVFLLYSAPYVMFKTRVLQEDLEVGAKYISGYNRLSYNRKPDQVKTEKWNLEYR